MPKFTFKLLRGRHSQLEPAPLGPDGNPQVDEEGKPLKIQRYYAAAVFDKQGNRTWSKNDDLSMFADPSDVVKSDLELDKIYNGSGPEIKFQRIREEGGSEPAAVPSSAPPAALMNDGLESMTVKQLQELAAGEEIDLGGETRKGAIVEKIRASR